MSEVRAGGSPDPQAPQAAQAGGHYVRLLHQALDAAVERDLAASISDLLRERGVHSVVDVGAGAGVLSTRLASDGFDVLAVEPNPAFAERLSLARAAGVDVHAGTIEAAAVQVGPRDAAVLSYVLDGLAPDSVAAFLDAVDAVVLAGGLRLAVTAGPTSPWASYCAAVQEVIGPCTPGGLRAVSELLGAHGREVEVVATVPLVIAADDLGSLVDRLAFFFRRREQAYLDRREDFVALLGHHADPTHDGRVGLTVTEVLLTWS